VAAPPEITALIADADEERAAAMAAAVTAEDGVTLLGVTGDSSEAARLSLDLLPDAVIIDLKVPAAGGLATFDAIHDFAPAIEVVLLAGPEDVEQAYQAITQGAAGCLQRANAHALAGAAVRGATRGEYLIPPMIAARVLHDVDAYAQAGAGPLGPSQPLTATEREVLMNLAAGHTPGDIARRYDVTARLVNLHTGYAVAKLQRHAERARAAAAL
jgi:DNA-binding NarL/FixJ family response regulator